jgi:DNA-directed RNA polymerase subunit F
MYFSTFFMGMGRLNAARLFTGYRISLLVLLLLFFAASVTVFASGGKQTIPELETADAMIESKNYVGAIQYLTEFARKNPEMFDQVQKRLRDIIAYMGDYTIIANKLLDMVTDDPENIDTILQMSRELTSMNAARRADTEQFIANIEEVARLTVNRRELDRILREARELLDRNEYLAALQKYQSGFDLYQEQMFSSGYGDTVNTTTRNFLRGINDFIASVQPIISLFDSTQQNIRSFKASIDNAGTLITAYESISPDLDRLVAAKSFVTQALNYFDEQAVISEAAEVKSSGRFFFPMIAILLRGRTDETIREGTLGTIDAIWNSAMEPLENSYGEMTDLFFSQAIAAFNNENFDDTINILDRLSNFNRTSLSLIDEWNAFSEPDGTLESIMGRDVAASKTQDFLKFESVEQASVYLARACQEANLYRSAQIALESENVLASWKAGTMTTEAALSQALTRRNEYQNYANIVERILSELDAEAEIHRSLIFNEDTGEGMSNRSDIRYFSETRAALLALRNKFFDATIQTVALQYTIANGNLERELSSLRELLEQERQLMAGVPLKLEDGTEITAPYPNEAALISANIDKNIQIQIENARRLLEQYQNENLSVAVDSRINALALEARSIASKFSDLQADNRSLAAIAAARETQAQNLLREARELLAISQGSLERGDFDAARDEAERSQARYSDSLGIQESPVVRSEIASRLNPLIAEIAGQKYEYTVMVVRGLVNNAREQYFAGNFERAEETLIRAETQWAVVSSDPEMEIDYWLTLVRGALFMRGGRTIMPTAPLYPEISQLLSSARKNYEEGMRLLSSNRRQDSLQMFAAAMRQTQEVRMMFPVNQDAGILELQIDQIIDPEAFNQNFSQRFQTAVEGTRRGSIESFADLQDLAYINPRYPGINAALVQAEINMGIRPSPPDPRRVTRSNELATAAERMFQANIRSQYPLVLENVNEALRLNPNNTLAMQLKDRVQVAMGSAQAADSYTEQEYIRAVREFQNGNNLLALSIVQRLLQRPENRNSVRLNELLQRIQSSM